jgi:hypothetical protein
LPDRLILTLGWCVGLGLPVLLTVLANYISSLSVLFGLLAVTSFVFTIWVIEAALRLLYHWAPKDEAMTSGEPVTGRFVSVTSLGDGTAGKHQD